MRHTRLLLILFVITVLSAVLFGTAAAQNTDIDTMSNEELMILLQSIMNKLEQDMEAETEQKEPEPTDTPVPTPADTAPAVKETAREPKKFSIYENKKLMYERMPDYLFIPKDTGGGHDDDDDDDDDGPGDNFHYGGGVYPIYGSAFIPPDIWTVW